MTELNIPDGMPQLSAGGHESPEQGACVMEYISIIKGESFSDYPRCTEPLVAHAAQVVNDSCWYGERAAVLLPRLERIMNAVPLDDFFPWDANLSMTKTFAVIDRARRYDIDVDMPVSGVDDPADIVAEWLDRVLDQYDAEAAKHGVKPSCPVRVRLTDDAVLIKAPQS